MVMKHSDYRLIPDEVVWEIVKKMQKDLQEGKIKVKDIDPRLLSGDTENLKVDKNGSV